MAHAQLKSFPSRIEPHRVALVDFSTSGYDIEVSIWQDYLLFTPIRDNISSTYYCLNIDLDYLVVQKHNTPSLLFWICFLFCFLKILVPFKTYLLSVCFFFCFFFFVYWMGTFFSPSALNMVCKIPLSTNSWNFNNKDTDKDKRDPYPSPLSWHTSGRLPVTSPAASESLFTFRANQQQELLLGSSATAAS